MRNKLPLSLLAALFSVHVAAQDNSRVEVFGGYSLVGYSVFQRYSGPSTLNKYNGWDASVVGRVAPHVGLEADFGGGFSGDYGIGTSKIYSYMGGPRIFMDRANARFYGHVLFGGMTFSSSSPGVISSTSFALAAAVAPTIGSVVTLGCRCCRWTTSTTPTMCLARATPTSGSPPA